MFSKTEKNHNIKGRADLIKPEYVDNVYLVHTGKEYKEIKISSNKVGMKFGEFAATKIPAK
jgi:ribosomal protein S19